MSVEIVRVVLLGGLSALLLALLGAGAWLISGGARRTEAAPPVVEEAPEVEVPPRRPILPAHAAPPSFEVPAAPPPTCASEPGQACWRGRLILPADVAARWQAARRSATPDGDADETDDGDGTDGTGEPGESKPRGPRPLPPAGSFADFFEVSATALPGEAGSGDAETAGTMIATALEADGSFELNLAPGRYDLVAVSRDGPLLVAGVEALVATADETREGLDLVLAPAVKVEGRVVDQDGVGVSTTISAMRAHHPITTMQATDGDGRFTFDGLWPGAYQIETHLPSSREGSKISVRAPVSGLELRVTRPPAAMLLIAAAPSGVCPRGRLQLRGPARERRSAYFFDCVAQLSEIPTGSTWRVQGEIGDRRYDRWITFATGTPPPPVCLDATCPANTSAVETRVVDAAGAGVDASVEIVDLAAARHVAGREVRVWRPSGSGRFLPWTTVRVRAVHEDLEAITTRMLAPGVNEILLRLPGRVTAAR